MQCALSVLSCTWQQHKKVQKYLSDACSRRLPAEHVRDHSCRPSGASELKHGFIQWLAMFVIVANAFALFEQLLFRFRTLDTYCSSDMHASRKGF